MMSDFLIISLEKFVIVISMMTDDLYTLPQILKNGYSKRWMGC